MSECTPGDDGYCTGGCVTRPHSWSASGARCTRTGCNVAGTGDPCNDGNCNGCEECSDEYGPCEDHGTAVVIRDGASTRTADELAVIYCDDAAALLEELGGTVLNTDRDIVQDAWKLLETERRHGVAWFPEDDAGEMLDECLRLGDALAADLSGLGHFTYWDDGYTIVRVHENCPLLED